MSKTKRNPLIVQSELHLARIRKTLRDSRTFKRQSDCARTPFVRNGPEETRKARMQIHWAYIQACRAVEKNLPEQAWRHTQSYGVEVFQFEWVTTTPRIYWTSLGTVPAECQ